MYKIPEEIKSGIYLGAGIYLSDLIIVAGFWFITSMFDEIIYPSINIVYTIFNIVLAIILTRPYSKNPGKKIYHVILFKFQKRMRARNQYYGRSPVYGEIRYKKED